MEDLWHNSLYLNDLAEIATGKLRSLYGERFTVEYWAGKDLFVLREWAGEDGFKDGSTVPVNYGIAVGECIDDMGDIWNAVVSSISEIERGEF